MTTDAKTKLYNITLSYEQLVHLVASLAEAGKEAKSSRDTRTAEGNTNAATHDGSMLQQREALLQTIAAQTNNPALEAAALTLWTLIVGEGGITPEKNAELRAAYVAQHA